MIRWPGWLLVLVLPGCGPSPPDDGVCRLAPVATLPLMPGRSVIVGGAVNRHPARMMLDTGSDSTYLSPWTVDEFGITRVRAGTRRLTGIGGVLTVDTGTARIELGGDEVPKVVGLVDLPPDGPGGRPLAALLGTDVLARYDVEVSFPDRRLRLWLTQGCTGAYALWTGPYDTLRLERGETGLLTAPVTIDGTRFSALVDTGADRSTIKIDAARRLGLDWPALAGDPPGRARGADGTTVQARLHRFGTVGLGSETFPNQPLMVSDVSIRHADMLLGVDWMRARRVWLSWSARRMFVQQVEPAEGAARGVPAAGQAAMVRP